MYKKSHTYAVKSILFIAMLLSHLAAGAGMLSAQSVKEGNSDFDIADNDLSTSQKGQGMFETCIPSELLPESSLIMDNEYVPQEDNLCAIIAEVNLKIFRGWDLGKDPKTGKPNTGIGLVKCIAKVVSNEKDEEGRNCFSSEDGFTRSLGCYLALAKAEEKCGGPAIEIEIEDEDY